MTDNLIGEALNDFNDRLLDTQTQAEAIKELEEVTGEKEYCEEIVKHAQLLTRIVEQVKSGYTKIRVHGVRCLANLASHDALKERIGNHEGVLQCLVGMVKAEVLEVIVGDQTKTKRLGCRTLANLAMDANIQSHMCEHQGMLACLFATLKGHDTKCLEQSCRCLFNLALHRPNHERITNHPGAVGILVTILTDSKSNKAQEFIGRLLAQLTTTASARRQVAADKSALVALVGVLQEGSLNERIRALAAVTVWHLCDDTTIAGAVVSSTDVAAVAVRLVQQPSQSVVSRQMLLCIASLSRVPMAHEVLRHVEVVPMLDRLGAESGDDQDVAFVCSDVLISLDERLGAFQGHSAFLAQCVEAASINSLTGRPWLLQDVMDTIHRACCIDALHQALCAQQPPLVPLLSDMASPVSFSDTVDESVQLAALSCLFNLTFSPHGQAGLAQNPGLLERLKEAAQGSKAAAEVRSRLIWCLEYLPKDQSARRPSLGKVSSGKAKGIASVFQQKVEMLGSELKLPNAEQSPGRKVTPGALSPSKVTPPAMPLPPLPGQADATPAAPDQGKPAQQPSEVEETDETILVRSAVHSDGAALASALMRSTYNVKYLGGQDAEEVHAPWEEICDALATCGAVVLDLRGVDVCSCHARLEAHALRQLNGGDFRVLVYSEADSPAWLDDMFDYEQVVRLSPQCWDPASALCLEVTSALGEKCKDNSAQRARLKKMAERDGFKEGVKEFNKKPSKGIALMQDQGYLDSPDAIAKFLYETAGLQKKQIGEYMGKADELNLAVLKSFTALFDFKGLGIDDGMRVFLNTFTLPGESQIIDRIIEAFGQRYMDCNPGTFDDPSVPYVLAFAIIMLNTDLHNPQITKKMTKPQFVSNNRGINNGQDLPQELLHQIYDRIKANELRITPDEEAGSTNAFVFPEHQGWLRKEGGKRKTVKRRWFILKANQLFYFKDPQEEVPLGTIPLTQVRVEVRGKEGDSNKYGYALHLLPVSGGKIKSSKISDKGMVIGQHDSFVFFAEAKDDRDRWVTVIKKSICCDTLVGRPGLPRAPSYSGARVAENAPDSSDDDEESMAGDKMSGMTRGKSASITSRMFSRTGSTMSNSTASTATTMSSPHNGAAAPSVNNQPPRSSPNAIPTLSAGQRVGSAAGLQDWGVEHVCRWVVDNKFGKYENHFRREQITGPGLMWLAECASFTSKQPNGGLFVAIMEQRLKFDTMGDVLGFAACLKALPT